METRSERTGRPARGFTARSAVGALTLALALGVGACGGDEREAASESSSTTAADSAAQPKAEDLAAIKTYLLQHTQRLVAETAALRADATAYHAMAKKANFDYDRLLQTDRAAVRAFVRDGQEGFARANPAYEEMEGVVAGVPELADYDVIIDAGGDASDPETAVPFNLETPAGKTYKQPGNFNYLIETSLFGTEPKWAAPKVEPDLDDDGRVEFGEAMPDADFYLAAARDFERNAKELDAASRRWAPTPEDAFTALVVMTPTMSEYFGAWKNSRFVAGAQADEKAFVVNSRLQDIEDILSGLELVYANVEPRIAKESPEQAEQTGASLAELRRSVARLRREEAGGRRFTAEEADALGSEAQGRAEAIAAQVSQSARRLDIKLETS